MGSDYLIDTNTVIYLLDKKLPPSSEAFLSTVLDDSCQLSVISQIELLSWPNSDANNLLVLETFIAACTIIDLSPAIIRQTISLRRNYKIKLPDAVIAATAVSNNWTLISRNDSDFRKVDGLSYLNPFTDL